MDLESKFTKEGLPILNEEFKESFYKKELDLEDFNGQKRTTLKFQEKIKNWMLKIELENEIYAQSVDTYIGMGLEEKLDRSTISCPLYWDIFHYIMLKQQGKSYISSYKMPTIKKETANKLNLEIDNLKNHEELGKYLEKIQYEILTENRIYYNSCFPMLLAAISNEGFKFMSIFRLSMNYKILKEQAKKDNWIEKIKEWSRKA